MKTIEVAAAVIKKGNKILATQRGYGDYKGYWEFPGGKLESGESPEEAVVRELKEEMAVTVVIDKFIATVEYDYPKFHLIMHCYLCHVSEGKLELLEHDDAQWLSLNELNTPKWLGADYDVLEAIKEQGILS